MLIDGVHAPFPDQPNEMHRAPRWLRRPARFNERPILEKTTVGDSSIDPHEILHHDAPST
jgi:hypothetical protein